MKGIIRAGGRSTRLYPSSRAVSKLLFPVYDKPAIYYPLSLLIMTGVTEILINVLEKDYQAFYELLGDGSRFGISISYLLLNDGPISLPETLMRSKTFIGKESIAIALGDNIFFGENLYQKLQDAVELFQKRNGATLFYKTVDDPRDYGVLEFDSNNKICSIESNPSNPKSNYAVTGLFFFKPDIFETIEKTKVSQGGSVSFLGMLRQYIKEDRLYSENLDDSIQWFDVGTPERLYLACSAVRDFQSSHTTYVGSVEEAALKRGLIDSNQLLKLAKEIKHNAYGRYLVELAVKTELYKYISTKN